MKYFAAGILILAVHTVFGQGPNFTAPAAACLRENLHLVNTSGGIVSHEWDFCEGDLSVQPVFMPIGLIGTATTALDIRTVEDNGHFYSFVCSASTDRIIRMDFSSDPKNLTPVSTEIDPQVATPAGIDVFKKGSQWYAVVGTFADPANVRLLTFGNSLANTPSVQTVSLPGPTQVRLSRAVRSVNEGSNTIVFFASSANGVVTRVVLDPAMDGSVLSSDNIAITGATSMFGLDLVSTGNNKFIVATDFNNGNIYKVALGNSFANAPASVVAQTLSQGVVSPSGIQVAAENGSMIGLLSTQSGQFFRLTWPLDMVANNPAQVQLTGINTNDGVRGLSMIRTAGHYYAYFTNFLYNTINRLDFEKSCNEVNTQLSLEESPSTVQYSMPGTYTITLRAKETGGNDGFVSKSLTVSGLTAPDLTIASNGVCAAAPVIFSTPGFDGAWSWDFGNGQNSTSANPTPVYATPGTYTVSLAVVAANGCGNYKTTPLKIYSKPVAAFTSPTGLICTNNEFTFANNTVDSFDGNLGYDWQVDGTSVGTLRDLVYAFTGAGDHSVTMAASIPGCSDEDTQQFNNVQTGPTVGFTIEGKCTDETIRFTNTSSGNILSYSWDLGNGQTSTNVSPSMNYIPGVYNVVLNVTGTNSCVSTTEKDLQVYSLPVAAFSLDLPPFSCAGTPSQFHDATPPPSDSNLSLRNWTFGDSGNGTGKDPTHTYAAAGTFDVQLQVTTDKGCSASVTLPVSIAASPVASFLSDPTCLNQSTPFTSTSTGGIKSWLWKVGNSTYTVENPVHVFAATGNSSVQLTVTGNNNCVTSVTKPVTVPVVPTLDFSATNKCSGQPVAFNDLTSSATDPITLHSWTFNGTATGTGQQMNFSFDNPGTYPVKLEVKNQSGCVYALTRPVAITTSPVATFTMSIDTGPPPLHVSFTNTSVGATSYKWDFNDGNALKTDVSPEYTYNALGQYEVDLTAISAEGCSRTLTKTVSVIVPVNELALEQFSLVQSGTAYRGYVRVRNNGNYRISGFNVSYDVGGGVLLQESVTASINPGQAGMVLLSNQFVSPASASYICAELQSDANLVDNKACTVVSDNAVILSPYPNPADMYLNIETVQPEAGTVRVRLYGSSGGNAYDRTFDAEAGLSRLTLDIQNLSPGIYVVVISAGNATTSRKILIHR